MKVSLGGIDYRMPTSYFLFVVTVGWLVRRGVVLVLNLVYW
jgi:hypothetical protein